MIVSCNSFSEKQHYDLLLKNTNIVNVETGEITADQNIVINNSRIYSVSTGIISNLYSFDEIVDAKNQYVIPGMWDMHAHPDDPELWRMEPATKKKDLLMPLFVINGVTGIRDMAGSIELVKRWREMGQRGELLVPTIFAGGPLLDGPNPMWDGSVGINNPEHVPVIVDSLINSGVDFLKVYSLLPRDIYFALADYANKIDYPFVGHVPFDVKPSEAAVTGMKSQEHLLEILNEAVANPERLNEFNETHRGFERYAAKNNYRIDHFDESKMDSLNQLFVKHDIWHTPTLSMWYKNAWFEEEVVNDDSLIQYLPPYLRKYWTPGVNDHLNYRNNSLFIQTKKNLFDKYLKIVDQMNKAGVKLLAGTDTGANPLCIPGVGVHNELKMLVKAGLTPLEALQTATLNPTLFLEIDNDYGTIETGKKADLVLLNNNPLENISNIRTIESVIHHGQLIDKKDRHSIADDILVKNNK